MLGETMKGRIASIDQDAHTCRVVTEDGFLTHDLVIPFYLRRESGALKKDSEVIFTVFPDNTGILLHRMDGDWEYKTIKALEVHGDFKVTKNSNTEDNTGGHVTVTDGDVSIKKGDEDISTGGLTAKSDIETSADVKTSSITLNNHVHGYTAPVHAAGSSSTTPGQ